MEESTLASIVSMPGPYEDSLRRRLVCVEVDGSVILHLYSNAHFINHTFVDGLTKKYYIIDPLDARLCLLKLKYFNPVK